MIRYWRLYGRFLEFSFSRALQFRLDFGFRILMDTAYYLLNFMLFEVLYSLTPSLAGWTLAQARVFIGLYILIDALHMTLFANNTWQLPSLVNKGDLDYYLVRPVSSLFFLSLRDFAANSFVNLLIAIGMLSWALSHTSWEFSLSSLGLLMLAIGLGLLLYYSLHMIFVIIVFWTQSSQGLSFFHWTMTRFMERPDRIYSGALRTFVTVVLPYGIIASFPARLIIEGFDVRTLLWLSAASFGFFGFLVWLWNRGLRVYASASS